MPRPKGLAKTGGRSKGTLNKRSSLLANDLEERGFSFPDELLKTYKNLDTDKRALFLLKMMDFYYTKPIQKEADHPITSPQVKSRFYTDEKGMVMKEMIHTSPDGQTIKVIIPDNGSCVDSPNRRLVD